MNDLIKALQIFAKYGDYDYPTICEHDELIVAEIGLGDVSVEDVVELERLGFSWFDGAFRSSRFGSA